MPRSNLRRRFETVRHTVPEGTEPVVLPFEDLAIVLVNSDLAIRTWLVEDTLVFGPDFVG